MIRTGFFFAVTFAATLFFSLASVVAGLVRAPKRWFDWIHRSWARTVLGAAGVTVRARGLEHVQRDRAQVLVANHQSMFDIWALMAEIPASLRFVAKQELARIPVFGSACRAAGHVFIDRSDPARAGDAIRRAGERIHRDGLALVLFPEGTRSADGTLGRFRRGAFALAIEMQAPLVPIAIQGGARILPRGARRIRPGTIELRCAPPIPLRGVTPDERDALAGRTRATIAEMLERGREPVEDVGGRRPAGHP